MLSVFQLANDLSSTNLVATIPVFDFVSGKTINIDTNVNWVATGPIQTQARGGVVSLFPFITIETSNSRTRSAQASGHISDGTTNYIPQPSNSAELISNGNTFVQVSHP